MIILTGVHFSTLTIEATDSRQQIYTSKKDRKNFTNTVSESGAEEIMQISVSNGWATSPTEDTKMITNHELEVTSKLTREEAQEQLERPKVTISSSA